jgi:prepilin-type N-terminal cleavage/methylation domain-containing protein
MILSDAMASPVRRSRSGVTLVEMLVAMAIGVLVVAGAMAFIYYAAYAVSGVTAQTLINQQAGNSIEFIQSRVRFATSISNDVSGNILTLGFDDNVALDTGSNGFLTNGISWDDKDHFEQFKFIGVNSTNVSDCASNQLVHIPNTISNVTRVLVPAGVRNLPGYKIFTMTNEVIAIIRFGIADNYQTDKYQSIDVQGTGVSLNRPRTNNVLSIIP